MVVELLVISEGALGLDASAGKALGRGELGRGDA